MVRLRGGHLVGADGVIANGTVVLAEGRIVALGDDGGASASDLDCAGCWVVPGFIDTHIHGLCGIDVLAGEDAVARVAGLLPRHGVTAFLPTSVACAPDDLAAFLIEVAAAGARPAPHAARVLGAHLESNFINVDYKGAQPARCLRLPPGQDDTAEQDGVFTGAAILATIEAHQAAVRIVTLAPELPGALDLIARLVAGGLRVSLGHSAATFEEGRRAIAAGARHATHLFNRMPPLSHRAPGLAGAVLAAPEVICEVVVDGVHLHSAMVGLVVRAKGPGGIAAITDATAGAGLPVGATAALGEHTIHVRETCAELADGTLAGSTATMDGVFRRLVGEVGLTMSEAVRLTSTTPADALGRSDLGRLAPGATGDVVVLDAGLQVRQTFVAGRLAWNSGTAGDVSPAEVLR